LEIGEIMATGMEDLRVLREAEGVADGIWTHVSRWEEFERDTVGKQLTRAVDSVGANIAESYGRFSYGEKLQFLYYARGSLFETKYWINRARVRDLLPVDDAERYSVKLTDLVRQLNSFAANLKTQRQPARRLTKQLSEEQAPYYAGQPTAADGSPLSPEVIRWLNTLLDDDQSLISNL
jgi:four helix bundle protein